MSISASTSVLAGPAVIHSDPEIVSGTPVFVGTRVPVRTLFDHIAAGDSLEDFLEGFPSVSRAQAVAALWQAHDVLVAASGRIE